MTDSPALDSTPLTGSHARRLRLIVAVAFFVNGAAFASWVSRIPALRVNLHLSNGTLGSVLFALSLGVLLSFPLASKGAQILGSRQMAFLAGLLTLAMLPVPFMVGIVPSLVLVLLEMGVANGMMEVSMNVLAVEVQARLGKPIMSRMHGLWSAGGLVGAGVGSLAARAGIAPTLHLGGMSVLLLVVLVTAFMASRKAAASMSAAGTVPGIAAAAPADEPAAASAAPQRPLQALTKTFRRAGLDRVLLGLGIVCFCSFLTEGALADWSALYLRDKLHASESLAALGYAVFAGAMMSMRLLGDRLFAHYGVSRLLRAFNAIGAGALAAALVAGRAEIALVSFAVMGLGLATVVPSAFVAAARRADRLAQGGAGGWNSTSAIALVSGFGYTGLLVGPPVVGWLAQATDLRWALGLLAVLTALIALLAPLLGRRESVRPAQPAALDARAVAR